MEVLEIKEREMNNFKNMLHDFFTDEEGQGTVEWILITALIVVATGTRPLDMADVELHD